MVKVIKLYPKGFASNCYFLTADGETAIAIDPGQPRILFEARKRGLSVKHILLTHGHFDHIGGCSLLQKAGAQIGCSEKELPLVNGADNMAEAFASPVSPFRIDFTVKDGEILELDGITVRVMETPGHTAGSVCYFAENNLFTGDTLFADGAGRTDLPTGNEGELRESLYRLSLIKEDYTVYTGHGENTTLDYEKKYNGYLR